MSTEDSLSQLVKEYKEAADITDDLSDLKRQKKAAKKVHACYKSLRESEEGGQGSLR